MTETDKLSIRALDGKSDYTVWRICVQAAIKAYILDTMYKASAFSELRTTTEDQSSSSLMTSKYLFVTDDTCQVASSIMISASVERAVRIVRTVIGHSK